MVVIPVEPKLNSLPEGRPVNPEPSPTKEVAVATPVITTPLLFACALTAPPNLIAEASIPVNAAPLPIKLVAVMIPALPILILLPTSICPIPPNEFAVTIPDTIIPVSVKVTVPRPTPVSYTHLTLPTTPYV